jgi:uncharacterized protein YndB with AHSA1/START domain
MSKIRIETYYPYSPEQVWAALTDSQALKQWLMDNDFKPVKGHKFQFRAKPNKHWNGVVDGEVLEISQHRKLVYSWVGDAGRTSTTVSWSLEAAEGGTRVYLEHSGFKGIGGFILSKLILGPGWKKLTRRFLPVVLQHIKLNGLIFSKGNWLIPEKECHSIESTV